MTDHSDASICPVCGAEVPAGAAACPDCGADERTGWSGDTGDEIPAGYEGEDDFDYDDFVRREFNTHRPRRRAVPIVIGLVLLALFLVFCLLHW